MHLPNFQTIFKLKFEDNSEINCSVETGDLTIKSSAIVGSTFNRTVWQHLTAYVENSEFTNEVSTGAIHIVQKRSWIKTSFNMS